MTDEITSAQRTLIAEITEVFDGVRRSNGMSLQQSEWSNRWTYCGRDETSEEAKAEYRHLCASRRDTSWQELTEEEIVTYSSLSFLNSAGLRYYLPAFMIYSIRHYPPDWRNCMAVITTLTSLCWQRTMPQPDQWELERWSKFTEEQSKATLNFLKYMYELAKLDGNLHDARDIRHAIDGYWHRFENIQTHKPKKKRPGKK